MNGSNVTMLDNALSKFSDISDKTISKLSFFSLLCTSATYSHQLYTFVQCFLIELQFLTNILISVQWYVYLRFCRPSTVADTRGGARAVIIFEEL